MKPDTNGSTRRFDFKDGSLLVTGIGGGRRRVEVRLRDPEEYCCPRSCETAYSEELLLEVVRAKSLAWTCDEILRDEDPNRVEQILRNSLFRYFPPEWFGGQRLLDFGCGSGASTSILARVLPVAGIVGVELDRRLIGLAEARRSFYGFRNVTIRKASSPSALSPDMGSFDSIVLNAVYEHLLPAERPALLPALWASLKVGGVLFICETPYRWSLVEDHTTGLPCLNSLSSARCWWAACAASVRLKGFQSWTRLLRMGIRGCDPEEVKAILGGSEGAFSMLTPSRLGYADHLDVWTIPDEEIDRRYEVRTAIGRRMTRKLREAYRHAKATSPLPQAAYVALAFRKDNAGKVNRTSAVHVTDA